MTMGTEEQSVEGELKAVLVRLDHHTEALARIERGLDRLNGTVHENREQIAVLKASTLRIDAIKVSAVIGAALVVIGVLLKIAGAF